MISQRMTEGEREFSLDGTYHSVFQTNSRAEAFSEPASAEACGCLRSPEIFACEGLKPRPRSVVVRALGNGMIEYDGFLCREQCSIPFERDEQDEAWALETLVKAVPAENSHFVEWLNGAGEVVSGAYPPTEGETVTAVFRTDADRAEKMTITVEVVGPEEEQYGDCARATDRTVAIQGFWYLRNHEWRYVNWDDPLIRWSKGWVAQEGAFKSSGEPGALARMTFSGSAVQALLHEGPQGGVARVHLDGSPETELCLGAGEEGGFKPLYNSLEETVAIEVLGEGRGASSGEAVAISGFSYFNPEEGRWVPTGLEDPAISWSNEWENGCLTPGEEECPAGKTYKFSDQDGALVEFTFFGTAATAQVVKGPDRGTAAVPGSRKEIDLYAEEEEAFEAVVYDGLANSVKVEVSGRSYISAGGEEVAVKGFRHLSPFGVASEVGWRDPAIEWHGEWEEVNGEYMVSSAPGSYAEFSGREVEVLLVKGPERGYAEIYLDGDLDRQVDLFSRDRGRGMAVKVAAQPARSPERPTRSKS